MKKANFKHIVLLLMISLMTVFTACSSDNTNNNATSAPVELDITQIAQEIVDGNVFKDTLAPIDSSYSEMLMKITTDEYVSAVIYMGSGATAERLAVFEAADSTAAEALKEKCTTHITEQTAAYADYMPEEVDKLNNAFVKTNGKYVILCVAQDYEVAKKMIGTYFPN